MRINESHSDSCTVHKHGKWRLTYISKGKYWVLHTFKKGCKITFIAGISLNILFFILQKILQRLMYIMPSKKPKKKKICLYIYRLRAFLTNMLNKSTILKWALFTCGWLIFVKFGEIAVWRTTTAHGPARHQCRRWWALVRKQFILQKIMEIWRVKGNEARTIQNFRGGCSIAVNIHQEQHLVGNQ